MKKLLLLSALVTSAGWATSSALLGDANDAANSGSNTVDRQETVTPQSQSNLTQDVDVTRMIRRALVKDSAFSVYAHNIKIITTKAHVVYLRGAISSSDDMGKIEALAKANANGFPVKNELTVSSH